jgi:hypothetical protein
MRNRWWKNLLLAGCLAGTSLPTLAEQPAYDDIDKPPHDYWNRPLKDRFTLLKNDLESGKLALDRSGEKAFLVSFLKALNIPVSSQMLVFSTTSLQLRFITPSNPRALYFTDDLYVGYIPGGRMEIVSLDPEVGGIFYIFDIPRGEQPVRVERSNRCMNCHAAADTQFVPGIVIKSVVPGPTGGSLNAFRTEQTGHGIPFEQRFGGWYLTGKHAITNHWGNLFGRSTPQGLTKNPVMPGKTYDAGRYPLGTSDILPQLLHEHQAGFVNRVLEASYRARTDLFASKGKLTAAQDAELTKQAQLLTRYLLYADEVSLPGGGLEGDATYKTDFLKDRKPAPNGASLRDFDLKTHLFKYRCSYMIYSPVFRGLPAPLKQRVYQHLYGALNVEKPEKDYAYLPAEEKKSIRAILKATLTDLPKGW